MDKPIRQNNEIDLTSDIVYRNVKFAQLSFEFKKTQFNEDVVGAFSDNFKMQINWILTATKKDKKGIIISCDFKLDSENLTIKILIQTKIEFKRILNEEEIFYRTDLQILTANMLFPYLTELISCNTAKMGITPVVLGYEVLERIIEETNKQGGFGKTKAT